MVISMESYHLKALYYFDLLKKMAQVCHKRQLIIERVFRVDDCTGLNHFVTCHFGKDAWAVHCRKRFRIPIPCHLLFDEGCCSLVQSARSNNSLILFAFSKTTKL